MLSDAYKLKRLMPSFTFPSSAACRGFSLPNLSLFCRVNVQPEIRISQAVDMRGTVLTEWLLFFSAPSAIPLVSVTLFGASALPVALTRGHAGAKLPFAALAAGSLRLSLLACTALLYLCISCLLCAAFLTTHCDTPPHEFFSLFNMRLILPYHCPHTNFLLVFLSFTNINALYLNSGHR